MANKITITKEILPNKPETREFDSSFIESERKRLIEFFENSPGTAYEAMIVISIMYTALARIYNRIGIENLPEDLRQKYNSIVNSAMLAHAMVEDLKSYLSLSYDKTVANELLKKGKNLETALQTWISEQVLQIDNYLARSGDIIRNDQLERVIKDYHGFIFQMFEKITFGFIAELLLHETTEDLIQQTFIRYSRTPQEIYNRLNNLKPVQKNRWAAAKKISDFNKIFGINNNREIGYELLERSGYSSSDSLVGFSEIIAAQTQALVKDIGKDKKYDFGSVKLPYPIDFIFPESPRIKQIKEFIANLPEDVRPSLIPNYDVSDSADNISLETYRAIFANARGSYGDDIIRALSVMLVIERAKLNLYLATGEAKPLFVKSLKRKIAILEELRRQEALELINSIDTRPANYYGYEFFTARYIRDLFLHASDLSRVIAASIEEVSNYAFNNKLPEIIIFFLYHLESGLIRSTKYAEKFPLAMPGVDNVFGLDQELLFYPLDELRLFDLHHKYRRREEEGPFRRPFLFEEFKKDLILNHSYRISPYRGLEEQRTALWYHISRLEKFQEVSFIDAQVKNFFLKQFSEAKVKPDLAFVNLFSTDANSFIVKAAVFNTRETLNKVNSQKPILNSNNLLPPKLETPQIINKPKPTSLLNIPNLFPNISARQQPTYAPVSTSPVLVSRQNKPMNDNWYRAIQNSQDYSQSIPFIMKLPTAWKPIIDQNISNTVAFTTLPFLLKQTEL